MTDKEQKRKEYLKAYYEAKKDKIKAQAKTYADANKDKIKEYQREYQKEHKFERDENYFKEYYSKNKTKIKEYQKDYSETNKEKLKEYQKEYQKEYYETNKEKYREYQREYQREYRKNKIKTDPIFKMRITIKRSILKNLKKNGFEKSSCTELILGCSFKFFKEYLESKFEPWMNWDNHGLYNGTHNYGWDIDHIIPSSSGLTYDEIIKLNHYTNLQPLCSKVNRYEKRDN